MTGNGPSRQIDVPIAGTQPRYNQFNSVEYFLPAADKSCLECNANLLFPAPQLKIFMTRRTFTRLSFEGFAFKGECFHLMPLSTRVKQRRNVDGDCWFDERPEVRQGPLDHLDGVL